MRMHFGDCGDGIYVNSICAIYRWYEALVTKPGTYRVIALSGVHEYMCLAIPEHAYTTHPTCVVDDFGSLVKVPA